MIHNEAAERAAQRDFARRMGDEGQSSQRRITLTANGKKPFAKTGPKPSGHEAFLKALESSNATVEVEKASSGDKIVGKIKASDKYTVSLRCPLTPGDWEGPYQTRVIFKHDISEFSPIIQSGTSVEAQ
jgi:sRNA-binding regulator protein Hfq